MKVNQQQNEDENIGENLVEKDQNNHDEEEEEEEEEEYYRQQEIVMRIGITRRIQLILDVLTLISLAAIIYGCVALFQRGCLQGTVAILSCTCILSTMILIDFIIARVTRAKFYSLFAVAIAAGAYTLTVTVLFWLLYDKQVVCGNTVCANWKQMSIIDVIRKQQDEGKQPTCQQLKEQYQENPEKAIKQQVSEMAQNCLRIVCNNEEDADTCVKQHQIQVISDKPFFVSYICISIYLALYTVAMLHDAIMVGKFHSIRV